MTYLDLINSFWKQQRSQAFTTTEIALFFYLLNEANSNLWTEYFSVSTNLICSELEISKPTFIKARNKLKQKSCIDFYEGKRNSKPKYKISVKNFNLSPNLNTESVKNFNLSVYPSTYLTTDLSTYHIGIDKDKDKDNNKNKQKVFDVVVDEDFSLSVEKAFKENEVFKQPTREKIPGEKLHGENFSNSGDVVEKYRYTKGFKEKLLSAECRSWLEIVGRQLKIPLPAFATAVDDFITSLKFENKQVHKDFEDFRDHFKNWVRYKKTEKQRLEQQQKAGRI